MRFFSVTLLFGFASMAVFGLYLMPYDGSAHDVDCFASFLNKTPSPCPQNDPLGFASFHNNAVKKILNLTILDSVMALYFLAFALVLFMFSAFGLQGTRFFQFRPLSIFELRSDDKRYSKILAWMSLSEKRDPSPLF